MKLKLLALCLLAVSCTPKEDPKLDGGFYVDPVDAGPPPIKYTQFTARVNGWPSGAPVRGIALQDSKLFAASDYGLYSLPVSSFTWQRETVALPVGEQPSSLQRIGDTLVMTTASETSGGVWTRESEGAWTKVAGAPAVPSWAIVSKSSDYFLVTTGGLYVASAFDGTYAARSDAGVFSEPVRQFVAAPAQQKMFIGTSSLWESNDNGVNWHTLDAGTGTISGLAANASFVLVATSDGTQLRSTNYGNTFYPQATGIDAGVSFYLTQASRFWAGNAEGVWTSDDDGVTFVRTGTGLPSETPVTGLFFSGSYIVADTVDGPYVTQQQ